MVNSFYNNFSSNAPSLLSKRGAAASASSQHDGRTVRILKREDGSLILEGATPLRNICGVYMILHKVSGKCYIGLSKNVRQRLLQHIQIPSGNSAKEASSVQKAIARSPHNFTASLLEEASTGQELQELEAYYIEYFDAVKKGYNKRRGGGGIASSFHFNPISPAPAVPIDQLRTPQKLYPITKEADGRIRVQFKDTPSKQTRNVVYAIVLKPKDDLPEQRKQELAVLKYIGITTQTLRGRFYVHEHFLNNARQGEQTREWYKRVQNMISGEDPEYNAYVGIILEVRNPAHLAYYEKLAVQINNNAVQNRGVLNIAGAGGGLARFKTPSKTSAREEAQVPIFTDEIELDGEAIEEANEFFHDYLRIMQYLQTPTSEHLEDVRASSLQHLEDHLAQNEPSSPQAITSASDEQTSQASSKISLETLFAEVDSIENLPQQSSVTPQASYEQQATYIETSSTQTEQESETISLSIDETDPFMGGYNNIAQNLESFRVNEDGTPTIQRNREENSSSAPQKRRRETAVRPFKKRRFRKERGEGAQFS